MSLREIRDNASLRGKRLFTQAFDENQMCESPKKFSPAPNGLCAPEAMDVQEDAGYVILLE